MATQAKRKRLLSPVSNYSEDSEYEVERIVGHRVVGNHHEFLVKWAGWSDNDNTWEPLDGLLSCREGIIDYFQRSQSAKVGLQKCDAIIATLAAVNNCNTRSEKTISVPSSSNPSSSFSSTGFPTPSPSPTFSLDSHLGNTDCDFTSPSPEPSPAMQEVIGTSPPDLTDECDENHQRVVTVLTTIPPGKEIYKIHGTVNVTGNLTILVEWDNDERELNLVDSQLINVLYPQKIIEFYEKHLQFLPYNNDYSINK